MENWLRYGCQMKLPGFNRECQSVLQNSKVLIVGAGGLGCPAAQYLVAAGVGVVALADHDLVAESNLHRQILFTPADVGSPKATIACKKLALQNPYVSMVPIGEKVTNDNVMDILSPYDIIIDATDNFEAKYLLNDACVLLDKPMVYGAIYQYEGQVSVWNVKNEDNTRSVNYRDLYPEINAAWIPDCTEGGVLPTIAGIIGSIQASEVIKYFINKGELLTGKLLIIDILNYRMQVIKLGNQTKTKITHLENHWHVLTITPGDLKQKLQTNKIRLIDVRENNEHISFNLGGNNIPLEELESYRVGDRKEILVFYCASGKRSAAAVKLIKRKYPEVEACSLEGGIEAWKHYNDQG
jgi:sulfur-carrier protein adenylyltransferase/sulfurtransferase